MTASDIILQFRAKGITISFAGESLKVTPPLLSENDRSLLIMHKAELLRFLHSQAEPLRRDFLSLWKPPAFRQIDTALLSRMLGRSVKRSVREEFAFLSVEELKRLIHYAKTGRTEPQAGA